MNTGPTPTPAADDLSSLLQSFVAAGGWIDAALFGLQSWGEMGAGAVALKDIQPHTALFHIPKHLILSPFSSDLQRHLTEQEWATLTGWSRLILVMMWEASKGETSLWHFYLRQCPTEFDTPMFWTPQQLEELIGTDIESELLTAISRVGELKPRQARVGKDTADAEYRDIVIPILYAHPDTFPRDSPHFTLTAYHVQGSRILSRSFTVPPAVAGCPSADPMDDDADDEAESEGVAVMIPIADMLNAIYEGNNARLMLADEEDMASGLATPLPPEGFTMISTEAISGGSQIFNTYSSPPNSELLRKYGHVDVLPLQSQQLELLDKQDAGQWPFGNPGDEVGLDGRLILHAAQQGGHSQAVLKEAEYIERVDLWLEEGYDDTFYLTLDENIDPHLIAFIKVLLYGEDWVRFKTKGKLPRASLDPSVHQVLGTAISDRLRRYRHDLVVDLSKLAGNEFTDERLRRAAIVRVGEQRILRSALKNSRQAIQNSQSGTKRKGSSDDRSPTKKDRR